MLRAILGVIVGYLVMAIAVAAVFMGLVLGLGIDRLFEPQTFNATMLLSVGTLVASFLCAVLGGMVCRSIAKRRGPALVLACIVFVFGLVSAVVKMNQPPVGPRDPNMSVFEAASQMREPTWYAFLMPFVGAAGVLVGGTRSFMKR
jgi:amino acid transporter